MTDKKLLYVLLGSEHDEYLIHDKSVVNQLQSSLSLVNVDLVSTKSYEGIRSLKDLVPDTPPIPAIIEHMKAQDYDLALLIPTDMPLMDHDLLTTLIDGYEDEDTIVCLRQHGTPYIEAFPAIYELAVLELLVSEVLTGNRSLQELLKHTGSHIIDVAKDNRLLKLSDVEQRVEIDSLVNG